MASNQSDRLSSHLKGVTEKETRFGLRPLHQEKMQSKARGSESLSKFFGRVSSIEGIVYDTDYPQSNPGGFWHHCIAFAVSEKKISAPERHEG